MYKKIENLILNIDEKPVMEGFSENEWPFNCLLTQRRADAKVRNCE